MQDLTSSINHMSQYTIVVLGDSKAGKTTLVSQYLTRTMTRSYKPTIEDCYRTLAQLPDGKYKTVNIIDTAGAMEFPAMRELRVRSANTVIIVYNVKEEKSINTASQLKKQVQEIRDYDGVPICVIGNLVKDSTSNISQQQIPAGIMDDSTCEHFYIDLSKTEQCERLFDSVIDKCHKANNWKIEVWTAAQQQKNSKPLSAPRLLSMLSFRKKSRRYRAVRAVKSVS